MERFRKAAVLLLAILIILSSCATTEGESYPSVSGTIVSISKYGNAMTSITSEEMKAADYQTGDLIAITVGDYSAIVPLGTNYSDVDRSSAVAVDDGNAIELAINYGGLDEITRLIEKARLQDHVDEKTVMSLVDNPEVPPPDFIARASGEKRLTGFLLLQSSYAELGFYDKLWPDWDESMVKIILNDFESRQRRFGGV